MFLRTPLMLCIGAGLSSSFRQEAPNKTDLSMSSKRDRAVSLGGDEGGSGGNDRLRRSKSASTLKEEKKKESKESFQKGFWSFRDHFHDGKGKGYDNPLTKGEAKLRRSPSPRFYRDEFYAQEAKLSLHERRMRYKTVDPVTLDDIISWSDYAKTLRLLSDKEVNSHYQDTMSAERHWYDPKEKEREKSRFAAFRGFGGGYGRPAPINFHFGRESDETSKSDDEPSWKKKASSSSSSYEEEDPSPNYLVDLELNSKVSVWQGDITRLEIDGIVNAANESLLGGGGIDGAIHAAAGGTLVKECKLLGGAETGETKATLGHRLPAKFILHTVGPRVSGKAHKLPKADLENCYTSTLSLVKKHKMTSVAFCSISTGIFGYPLAPATHSAIRTVRKWLENKKNRNLVDRIIFCVFSDQDRRMYEEVMQVYFPLPPLDTSLQLPKLSAPTVLDKYSVDQVEETIRAFSRDANLNLEGLKAFIKNSELGQFFLEFTFPAIVKLALDFPSYLEQEEKQACDFDSEVDRSRKAKLDANIKAIQIATEKREAEVKKIKAKYENKPPETKRPSPETVIPPVLVLPRLIRPGFGSLPLLVPLCDNTLVLRRTKIASILALAFLCTFPEQLADCSDEDDRDKPKSKRKGKSKKDVKYSGKGKDKDKNKESRERPAGKATSLPPLNFAPLFYKAKDEEYDRTQAAKLTAIVNYFNVVAKGSPEGHIYLRRKFFSGLKLPTSEGFTGGEKNAQFTSFSKESSTLHTITDPGVKQLYACERGKVPLAGVLHNRPLSQVEKRAFTSPELLVIPFLSPSYLMPNESIEIQGVLNYNHIVTNSEDDDSHRTTTATTSTQYHGFQCRSSSNVMSLAMPKKASMNPKDRLSEFAALAHRPRSGSGIIIVDLPIFDDPLLNFHRYNYALVNENGDSFVQKETTVSIAIGPFASSSPFFCPIDLQLLFLMLVISRIAADQDVKRLQVALHGVVQKYSAFNSLYNTLRSEKVEIPEFWRHLVFGLDLPKFKEFQNASRPPQDELFKWCEWRFKGWKKEQARLEVDRQAQLEKQRIALQKKKKELKKMKKEMEKRRKEEEKDVKGKNEKEKDKDSKDNNSKKDDKGR